jgi:hypothetical protein
MEEILASIRRIISEDAEAAEGEAAAAPKAETPAAPAAPAAAPPVAERPKRPLIADVESEEDESDVLLLTQEMEEEAPAAPFLREEPPAFDEPPPEPPRRAPEPLSFEAAPEPLAETDAEREEPGSLVDRLLSDHAAAASLAAMSELLSRRHREPKIESLPMGNANQTLEDLTRELLRPILKTWLDENLPQIVERIVREEIGRLAVDAQRR